MPHERKAPDLQTRDLTTRSLTIRSDTLDEDTRSVEAVLATEKVTTVFEWARLEMIDESLRMSGAQFGEQVVMLETHSRWSLDTVLGSVRELKVEGGKLIGRLGEKNPDKNIPGFIIPSPYFDVAVDQEEAIAFLIGKQFLEVRL